MKTARIAVFWLPTAAVLLMFFGCSSRPAGLKAPPIQPAAAADAAMSQYDKNGDGRLADGELANSPALAVAIKRLDQDQDGSLSRDELFQRFTMWVEGGVGLSPFGCRVTVGGKPLEGAQVRLLPEEFFGGTIQLAEGITDATGTAALSIDKSHLPTDLQNLRAMQQGLYRVEITHPTTGIPAKYNTDTSLGIIVSFETGGTMIPFDL